LDFNENNSEFQGNINNAVDGPENFKYPTSPQKPKNNKQPLIIFFASLIGVLLLISGLFVAFTSLIRPPVKDSIITSQIPKTKKVYIDISRTQFSNQTKEAMDKWNKALNLDLFVVAQSPENANIKIVDMSDSQIKDFSDTSSYGTHILGVTSYGQIGINADYMGNHQTMVVPVLEHELGHVIGLAHINGDALMNASMQSTAFITRYDVKVAKYILKNKLIY
jgi:hypothetical protein